MISAVTMTQRDPGQRSARFMDSTQFDTEQYRLNSQQQQLPNPFFVNKKIELGLGLGIGIE